MAKNYEKSISTGVGKAYYAIINSAGTYETPKELGDIISFSVDPSESTNSFWAGDRQVIIDASTNVTGNIVVPALTNEVLCDLFGYEMSTDGGVIYNTRKARPNMALLLVQNNYAEVQDFITLYKTRLQIGGKTGSTKTDSITYGNVTLNFDVMLESDGVWMHVVSSDEADCKEGFATTFVTTAPEKPMVKPAE